MATVLGKMPVHAQPETTRSIRLSDLLALWPQGIASATPPLADPPLVGITDDSRQVKPGWLFVAVKGLKSDGHDFIPKAIETGAAELRPVLGLDGNRHSREASSG